MNPTSSALTSDTAPSVFTSSNKNSLNITFAQLDARVGDIDANLAAAFAALKKAEEEQADLLIFPELFLTGYPPEDLLFKKSFVEQNLNALHKFAKATTQSSVSVLLGFVDPAAKVPSLDSLSRQSANAAAYIEKGLVKAVYHKQLLPNYSVFDEARYFTPGSSPLVVDCKGVKVAVLICEDLWRGDLPASYKNQADLLAVLNASPYSKGKSLVREELVSHSALLASMPVCYINLVGGQDELVFDGSSIGVDKTGEIFARLPAFKEAVKTFTVSLNKSSKKHLAASLSKEGEVYLAVVTGLKAYVSKNNFPGVLLGLSGGIDSALCAALAADALGGEKVWGVGLPGPFSSDGSITDAKELACRLKCRFDVISIKKAYDAELDMLHSTGVFAGTSFNVAEENIQARLRGLTLMAISNKFNPLLLTTGNKSEVSVGFCTLYGDTSGGFAPLKDLPKTLVFSLSAWRNTLSADKLIELGLLGPVNPIPELSISKPPSAELAENQEDTQSLPPYEVLDAILKYYVEESLSATDIIAKGFEAKVVLKVARLVDMAEYKRRQAPPGVKISSRAFGRDYRMPITKKLNIR